MMVDTTVYGLVGDGGIMHANSDCVPGLMTAEDGSHTYAAPAGDGTFAELHPVYYLDDDGRGLTCDSCSEYIWEPAEDYCGDCDDFHESSEDEHEAGHHENGKRKAFEGVQYRADSDLECELCDAEAAEARCPACAS